MQPTALSPGFILNSFPKACVFTVNEMWSCVANVRMTSSEHRGSNQKHRLRRDSWYKMALWAIMRLQIFEESFRAARGTIKEKKRKKKRNKIKFIMGIIWVWGDICARSDNESGETTKVTETRCRWMESQRKKIPRQLGALVHDWLNLISFLTFGHRRHVTSLASNFSTWSPADCFQELKRSTTNLLVCEDVKLLRRIHQRLVCDPTSPGPSSCTRPRTAD